MEIDAIHARRASIIMTRNHRLSPLPTRSCNTQQHMFINASQLCMFVLARVSTPININCIFVGERFYAYLRKFACHKHILFPFMTSMVLPQTQSTYSAQTNIQFPQYNVYTIPWFLIIGISLFSIECTWCVKK